MSILIDVNVHDERLVWPNELRDTILLAPVIEAALRTDPLRIWAKGSSKWASVALEGENSLEATVARGVMDAVESLKLGREPELSSRKVIKATELIFATYESARRGGRIDLPVVADDSTILATA